MLGRPATSMSSYQSTNSRQRANTTRARPNTAMSMSTHASEDDSTAGVQNCMMPPSSSFRSSATQHPSQHPAQHQSDRDFLSQKKIRKAVSVQSLGFQTSQPNGRNSSVTSSLATAFGKLNIQDERPHDIHSNINQVVSVNHQLVPSAQLRQQSINNIDFRKSRRGADGSQTTPSRVSSQPPPETPSHTVQEAQNALNTFEQQLASVSKTPGSPLKSSSPTKRTFLTKESNIRGFAAWDVDERLHEVEAQFKAMKEVMNGSLGDRKALEEVIDLAKTRGKAI